MVSSIPEDNYKLTNRKTKQKNISSLFHSHTDKLLIDLFNQD